MEHLTTKPSSAAPPLPPDPSRPRNKRKRAKGPRSVMPITVDVKFSTDRKTVEVPLQGAFGRGKVAVVDAAVWLAIAEEHGSVWGVNFDGTRKYPHICRGSSRVARAAKQRGPRPKASLARLVAQPTRGQIVTYRNGDPFDLRRVNLLCETRAEAGRRRMAFAHG